MAVDTNWNKADSIVDAHPVFIVAENIFCLYFTVEWVIRLMAFEEKLYGLNSNWFMFDTVLVVMMVLETWVAVAILLRRILDDDSFSLGDVAILRLLRLLRLSRLVRMLRALPELLILVKGALRAMKTVMFVISLLFAITYVFGIAMVLLLEGTSAGAEMFPTVPQAMYSLLLYGTLLDNLVFVCAKLEESSVVGLGVFFIYIALAALTVLNMLIGVLCEMVSLVAHQEKDRMLTILAEEKLALVIKNLDQNDDFRLSKREFLDILVNPSAAQALTDIGVDPIGVIDFADLIFSNEVGQEADLSFEEFMEIILQLRGTNSSTVRHMIELKHMIAQQLDDLTREVQEYHRHMDITHSFSPASFKGDPVDSLASLRSGEGAETPSGRPSADVSVAPPGRMSHCSVKDSFAEPSVGHFHSAPDKLVADARRKIGLAKIEMSQPWSKCKGCGRDEYNHVLLQHDRRCRCGRQVKLYQPKTKGGDQTSQALQLSVVNGATKPSTDGGKGSKVVDEISLMEQTLTATTDPLLRKLLTDELQKKREALRPTMSPEEQIKHASGAWKDATVRHDQAVQGVLKARENLEKAEAKERETSLILARAEEAKRAAAATLAKQMGLTQPAATPAAPEQKVLFKLDIDDQFFQELEKLDLEGDELAKLRDLERQLREAQQLVEGKHTEVKDWQARTAELKAAITERMAKKRKGSSGAPAAAPPQQGQDQGATPSGPAAEATAPAESEEDKQKRIEEVAARISAAKMEAAKAARAAAMADGPGAAAVGGGPQ
ncbi:unnamed protein product [Prorocentrum cordatum]|uniref:Ion transport domain-containing protein n=1 Tax=Prorocentrum cordatum TaxID=2364126 RepID=A0ABN9PJA4_9DINO|nr:unnamed protein product [Polarella glacialis]